MKKYTVLIERSIMASLGFGLTAISEIEIECESDSEALRHAHTLIISGDKIVKIFPSEANIWIKTAERE